jgi:hypothetical protein
MGEGALELLDGAGTQVDPDVVNAFVTAAARRVPYRGVAAA